MNSLALALALSGRWGAAFDFYADTLNRMCALHDQASIHARIVPRSLNPRIFESFEQRD